MIEILGAPRSINVRKVLWLCEELRLAHQCRVPGVDAHALDSAAFRALNPNGTMPVIVDGDFVLWESNTICRYLTGRESRADLLPTSPRERARVEQWLDWQATDLNGAWRYAFLALKRRSPAHRDAMRIAESVADWNRRMQLLDAQLATTGGHVAREAFSLADIVIGLSVQRWWATPMDKPRLDAVGAYRERLMSRAGFARHGVDGEA